MWSLLKELKLSKAYTFSLLITFCVAALIVSQVVHGLWDCNDCFMTYSRPSYNRISFPRRDDGSDRSRLTERYSLFQYSNIGQSRLESDDNDFRSLPIIFVPGHQGFHAQGRSLGAKLHEYSTMLMNLPNFPSGDGNDFSSKPIKTFSLYILDFSEESTLMGSFQLEDQAEFVEDSVFRIQELYLERCLSDWNIKKSALGPSQCASLIPKVMIMGHSMGGVVSRLALMRPNFPHRYVSSVMTIASPLRQAPVVFNEAAHTIYGRVESVWAKVGEWAALEGEKFVEKLQRSEEHSLNYRRSLSSHMRSVIADCTSSTGNCGAVVSPPSSIKKYLYLANIPLIALTGGTRDIIVGSTTTSMFPALSTVPARLSALNTFLPGAALSTLPWAIVDTREIPAVGFDVDHLAILWCQQLLESTVVGLVNLWEGAHYPVSRRDRENAVYPAVGERVEHYLGMLLSFPENSDNSAAPGTSKRAGPSPSMYRAVDLWNRYRLAGYEVSAMDVQSLSNRSSTNSKLGGLGGTSSRHADIQQLDALKKAIYVLRRGPAPFPLTLYNFVPPILLSTSFEASLVADQSSSLSPSTMAEAANNSEMKVKYDGSVSVPTANPTTDEMNDSTEVSSRKSMNENYRHGGIKLMRRIRRARLYLKRTIMAVFGEIYSHPTLYLRCIEEGIITVPGSLMFVAPSDEDREKSIDIPILDPAECGEPPLVFTRSLLSVIHNFLLQLPIPIADTVLSLIPLLGLLNCAATAIVAAGGATPSNEESEESDDSGFSSSLRSSVYFAWNPLEALVLVARTLGIALAAASGYFIHPYFAELLLKPFCASPSGTVALPAATPTSPTAVSSKAPGRHWSRRVLKGLLYFYAVLSFLLLEASFQLEKREVALELVAVSSISTAVPLDESGSAFSVDLKKLCGIMNVSVLTMTATSLLRFLALLGNSTLLAPFYYILSPFSHSPNVVSPIFSAIDAVELPTLQMQSPRPLQLMLGTFAAVSAFPLALIAFLLLGNVLAMPWRTLRKLPRTAKGLATVLATVALPALVAILQFVVDGSNAPGSPDSEYTGVLRVLKTFVDVTIGDLLRLAYNYQREKDIDQPIPRDLPAASVLFNPLVRARFYLLVFLACSSAALIVIARTRARVQVPKVGRNNNNSQQFTELEEKRKYRNFVHPLVTRSSRPRAPVLLAAGSLVLLPLFTDIVAQSYFAVVLLAPGTLRSVGGAARSPLISALRCICLFSDLTFAGRSLASLAMPHDPLFTDSSSSILKGGMESPEFGEFCGPSWYGALADMERAQRAATSSLLLLVAALFLSVVERAIGKARNNSRLLSLSSAVVGSGKVRFETLTAHWVHAVLYAAVDPGMQLDVLLARLSLPFTSVTESAPSSTLNSTVSSGSREAHGACTSCCHADGGPKAIFVETPPEEWVPFGSKSTVKTSEKKRRKGSFDASGSNAATTGLQKKPDDAWLGDTFRVIDCNCWDQLLVDLVGLAKKDKTIADIGWNTFVPPVPGSKSTARNHLGLPDSAMRLLHATPLAAILPRLCSFCQCVCDRNNRPSSFEPGTEDRNDSRTNSFCGGDIRARAILLPRDSERRLLLGLPPASRSVIAPFRYEWTRSALESRSASVLGMTIHSFDHYLLDSPRFFPILYRIRDAALAVVRTLLLSRWRWRRNARILCANNLAFFSTLKVLLNGARAESFVSVGQRFPLDADGNKLRPDGKRPFFYCKKKKGPHSGEDVVNSEGSTENVDLKSAFKDARSKAKIDVEEMFFSGIPQYIALYLAIAALYMLYALITNHTIPFTCVAAGFALKRILIVGVLLIYTYLYFVRFVGVV